MLPASRAFGGRKLHWSFRFSASRGRKPVFASNIVFFVLLVFSGGNIALDFR